MKYLTLIFSLLFLSITVLGQSVYSFSRTLDTATEGNTARALCYIRAIPAPSTADSVMVIVKAGLLSPSHADTSRAFKLYFAAGVDSVPFIISLTDDTLVEFTENITYALSSGNTSVDSLLNFTLVDNDSALYVEFDVDSAWQYEHIYTDSVKVKVYNPNAFYSNYTIRSIDVYANGATYNNRYPNITASLLDDFYFSNQTIAAPPGKSTGTIIINNIDNLTVNTNKTLGLRVLENTPNQVNDPKMFFTIVDDDTYIPPTVSFDLARASTYKINDTILKIPFSVVDSNWYPITARILFDNTGSTARRDTNFNLLTTNFSYSHGGYHDTLKLRILDDLVSLDTLHAYFKINVIQNLAVDTQFKLTIIGHDSLLVSFLGAGRTHLKSDSIGYVRIYSKYQTHFPVSVDIKYLNGNATPNVDFKFQDSTIVFQADRRDTISLPVVMLRDGRRQGNEQVNLSLSNPNPSSVYLDIVQYTYTIIDDDTLAIVPTGLDALGARTLSIYPNPTSEYIYILGINGEAEVSLLSEMGQEVRNETILTREAKLDLRQLAAGIYSIQISELERIRTFKIVKLP